MIALLNSDARYIPLADQSVQCIITSPPYYGLRDYGIGNQIGLEATPAAYVASIVAVMRECWRVLRDDGVLWLNLGDSYATTQAGSTGTHSTLTATGKHPAQEESFKIAGSFDKLKASGLKPKDLIGIPWRVAFALQEDGWYLRSDVIWHKPNPMPESVTDRPTKAHEYVFLLTKQARYYYDAEAIKEPANSADRPQPTPDMKTIRPNDTEWHDNRYAPGPSGYGVSDSGRNRRSVWTVATSPYSGAHFATFPPKLIEPMILAGTSERGECPHCGKAWVRVVEKEMGDRSDSLNPSREAIGHERIPRGNSSHQPGWRKLKPDVINDVSWQPQCACPPHEPIPQIVFDPFTGTATVGRVAIQHGRRFVGCDLNTKYITDLAPERTSKIQITMPL